ncbi:hypothetical protein HYPSUDRAFT_199440 [Hypholoma sublateritium FD-334 SS-4]|uniref:Uncharacterized protein n=1 Tax=Hypholoma sublateritium (strain FD-334 SS-4) TaxID=945553 RepID=A0A0D2PAY2_HYPSF|nr:hypothetical protein HYPSUDRAFT_199440 [Hypholoma sublateritium FD-334 SS-4]
MSLCIRPAQPRPLAGFPITSDDAPPPRRHPKTPLILGGVSPSSAPHLHASSDAPVRAARHGWPDTRHRAPAVVAALRCPLPDRRAGAHARGAGPELRGRWKYFYSALRRIAPTESIRVPQGVANSTGDAMSIRSQESVQTHLKIALAKRAGASGKGAKLGNDISFTDTMHALRAKKSKWAGNRPASDVRAVAEESATYSEYMPAYCFC